MPRDLRLSVLNKPGNKLSQPIRSIPCPLSTNQISLLFTKTHNNLRRYSLSKCHVYLLEVTVGEELARNGHGFYPSWVQKTTEVEYKVIKYDLQVTGISYLLVTKYSSSEITFYNWSNWENCHLRKIKKKYFLSIKHINS